MLTMKKTDSVQYRGTFICEQFIMDIQNFQLLPVNSLWVMVEIHAGAVCVSRYTDQA